MKKILLSLITIIITLSQAIGQSNDTYLPSEGLSKLNGTWVGSYNGIHLKIILKSRKRFVKDGNYSTDFLEGSFAYSRQDVKSIQVDTTIKTITEGHFFNQSKKDVIVLGFTDRQRSNKKGKVVLTPIPGESKAYQMNVNSLRKLKGPGADDDTFSVPKSIVITKIE